MAYSRPVGIDTPRESAYEFRKQLHIGGRHEFMLEAWIISYDLFSLFFYRLSMSL